MKKLIVPGGAYFITTKVYKNQPVFTEERHCQIIINNLKFYRKKFRFLLLAYVIMPDHFHFVIFPDKAEQLPAIMRDFKKFMSVQIIENLKITNPDQLKVFEVNSQKQKHKIWQSDFFSVYLDHPHFVRQKIEYIHQNPVKKNLVQVPEEYKYSSARNYYLADDSIIKIDHLDLF